MKVRCASAQALLMFVSLPEAQGGGVYRVDPGEEFEVPDGTQLPPGIERMAPPVEEPPAADAARKGDA